MPQTIHETDLYTYIYIFFFTNIEAVDVTNPCIGMIFQSHDCLFFHSVADAPGSPGQSIAATVVSVSVSVRPSHQSAMALR